MRFQDSLSRVGIGGGEEEAGRGVVKGDASLTGGRVIFVLFLILGSDPP